MRAQAGVRVSTLVKALAERGQELPLTPEMGEISLGAMAVTTLPQASYGDGMAQLSSCVTEMKLITPQGKQMIVTERERDLMRVLRSSFGLLGIVHEVVLRVRPLTPVKIDYQVMTLKEFTLAVCRHGQVRPARCVCMSRPSTTGSRVERRTLDESAAISRSGIWQIKQSVMRNVLPAFGSTVGSVLAAPGLRTAVLSGMHRALGGRQPRRRDVFARVDARHAERGLEGAPYLQPVGFSARPIIRKLLGAYFAFCKSYYKQHRYRGNVVSGASRLHQDRGSLFSASYSGPMFTLEPSSTRRAGLGRLPDRFQRFRLRAWRGTPTFNQTPCAAAGTRGEGLRRARQAVPRTAPAHRSLESAAQQLLRVSSGLGGPSAWLKGRRRSWP